MKRLTNQFLLWKFIIYQKKLKNKKASSVDSLSNEIIKLAVKVLPLHFVKIFNTILSKGVFPSAWAKGNIVPIYKSGNTFDPGIEEYVSVVAWGNFNNELIMNTHLNKFLEENNIISVKLVFENIIEQLITF
jgi:hypothetical protein